MITTFVLAVIVAFCVVLVAQPFISSGDEEEYEQRRDKLNELMYRKELLLSAIKDAELEFHAGKLSRDDFNDIVNHYKLEAIQVMKRLDFMQTGRDIYSLAEKEIQSWKKRMTRLEEQEGGSEKMEVTEPVAGEAAQAPTAEVDEQAETEVQVGLEQEPETLAKICPACGNENMAEAHYCSECGKRLEDDE